MNRTYTLANITVSSDNGDLASKHDIGSTLDTIDEGLAAAVVVVKLGLRDGVVDVDGGNLELSIAEHFVKVVDTGGSLFRETADVWHRDQTWFTPSIIAGSHLSGTVGTYRVRAWSNRLRRRESC